MNQPQLQDPPEPADARRAAVLEVAARILASDGPHGLSLRRVASEAGGSTQLVYTLFGGKQGLADGLYAEGFARLAQRMRAGLEGAPPPGDPERLMALGRAYRQFALAEPAFFSVMFGRSIPGFSPRPETRSRGRACSYGQVVREAQACLDAGRMRGGSAEELARLCWATGHGVASLEAAGLLGDEVEQFAEMALRTPVDAHRAPPAHPVEDSNDTP